jgi:hypothetical protein
MSSSGFADGLGRRSISFDREDGSMLERLVVRPELAAFEPALRDRLERLAATDDERVARPRAIVRESDGGLIVVSEFVPGSRLADLIDAAVQRGAIPGVDVAFGYLLDALPALCGLHAGAGFSHGAISAGRVVITPAGQVVLLDAVFGSALQCLNFGRRRLWDELDIATRPGAGPVRFDAGADIAQVALTALMLVIGRPVQADEYPDRLASLLVEVLDVAMIRGTADFAAGLQTFLQRALPLPSSRPYTSADEALFDLRELADELGPDVCRRALVDFIEQMEGVGHADVDGDEEGGAADGWDTAAPSADDLAEELDLAVDEDDEMFEMEVQAADPDDLEPAIYDLSSPELTDDLLPFVPTIQAPPPAPMIVEVPRVEPEPQAAPGEHAATPPDAGAADTLPLPPETAVAPVAEVDAVALDAPAPADYREATREDEPEPEVAQAREEERKPAVVQAPDEESEPAVVEAGEEKSEPAVVPAREEAGKPDADEAPDEKVSAGSRRRKRNRSVKSRKDKLRSAAAPAPALVATAPVVAPPAPAATPTPPPPKPVASSPSWLVSPERAASFEPPVPEAFPPPPIAPAAPQPAPFAASPPTPGTSPFASPPAVRPPAQPMPATAPLDQQPLWTPPPLPNPASSAAAAPQAPAVRSTPALKLKTEIKPKKTARTPSVADIYAPPPPVAEAPRRSFPWKGVAVAAALAIATAAGWPYLSRLPGAAKIASAAKALPSAQPAAASPVAAGAAPSRPGTGRMEIETQPSGARVLLDGKPAGDTPLSIESVSPGRHTLTFESSAGTIRRTVRVESGKTLTVDVPIYSGWVGIFAPIVLDVSADGKSIGTTDEPRLMLPPGRHDLELTNKALGYSVVHTVDIEPGEVRSVTLDPQGVVNVNATPWAEVWIDGRKAGDTPIANLKLRLGVREILFKHPEFGERRVTVTVKADAPGAVTIDMSR